MCIIGGLIFILFLFYIDYELFLVGSFFMLVIVLDGIGQDIKELYIDVIDINEVLMFIYILFMGDLYIL